MPESKGERSDRSFSDNEVSKFFGRETSLLNF